MNKKLIAIILTICLIVPSLVFGINVFADEPYSTPGRKKVNGLATNKTVQDNNDGSYDVTLEAWAESDHIEQAPTDTALVLDTSYRMTKTLYERTNFRNLFTHTILEYIPFDPSGFTSDIRHRMLYDNNNPRNGERFNDNEQDYSGNKYVKDPNCPDNYVYLAQRFYKDNGGWDGILYRYDYHYDYYFIDSYGNKYVATPTPIRSTGISDIVNYVRSLSFTLVERGENCPDEIAYPEGTPYVVEGFYSRPKASSRWYEGDLDNRSTVSTLLSYIDDTHDLYIKDNNGIFRKVAVIPAEAETVYDVKAQKNVEYIPYYTFVCEFSDEEGDHRYETVLGNPEYGAEFNIFHGFKEYIKKPGESIWTVDLANSLASKSLYVNITENESAENVTKLQALKEAVEDYILKVHIAAVTNGSDEHLAVVKYSRDNPSGFAGLLDGTQYTQLVYSLDDVDMANDAEVTKMIDTIYSYEATTASGLQDYANLEARLDMGMQLAYNELNGNGNHTGHTKNCVVFTAGVPAFYGTRYRFSWWIFNLFPYTVYPDHYDTIVADEAIRYAKQMKDNLNANVYTVGLFENANEEQLYGDTFYYSNITYRIPIVNIDMPFKDVHIEGNVGDKWGITDAARALTYWTGREVDPIDAAAINRMLNYISSDFYDSDNVGLTRGTYSYHYGILGNGTGYRIDENFPREDYGYYFAIPVATEEDDANEFANTINQKMSTVFKTIAAATTTPSVILDENAMLHDVVTEYFKIKPNTTIMAYSESLSDSTDKDYSINLVETEDESIIDATNFDYMGHYAGSDDPRKIVVKFTIVPQDDFLGGNVVPTNTRAAGIFDETGTLEENFDVPNVDVAIKEAGYVENQSIYYNDVADILDMIQKDAVNGINNQFVNVTYTIKDETGATVNTCTIPAGTAEMNWSNGDLYDETDTSFSNETRNHPRLTETKKYQVITTVHPIYNRTYGDQTNTEDAYVYVFKPLVTQRNDELVRPAQVDITPISIDDIDQDNPPYNYYEWVCEEATENNPVAVPTSDAPILEFTIKVGDTEVLADANDLYTYYVDTTTDFTITNVEVKNLPHHYTYKKIVTVKDENGNVQRDENNQIVTSIEEDDRTVNQTSANLTPSDKVIENNTKSIFDNVDKNHSDAGVFTIAVGPQNYTLEITKTFKGPYAISENVNLVFSAAGETDVVVPITFDGTQLSNSTPATATLKLGTEYTVTEAFPDAGSDSEKILQRDQQYRTTFTPENNDDIAVSSRADAQGEGTEAVSSESLTFIYNGNPDDVVTFAVLNRDISDPPPVTGKANADTKVNPFLIAAGVIAALGSAWIAYLVRRKSQMTE